MFELICPFPNQPGVTPQTIEIVTYGSDDLLPSAVLFDADTSVLAGSIYTERELCVLRVLAILQRGTEQRPLKGPSVYPFDCSISTTDGHDGSILYPLPYLNFCFSL